MNLLSGYRVLDLTGLRGQMCGKLLADLGAEVIKVESPEGDEVRRVGPFVDGASGPSSSIRFNYLNAGKRSVVLDLGDASGRDSFFDLLATADVLIESADPGYWDGLGLSPDSLLEKNLQLIITSITSFGQTGPHRDYLGPHLVAFAKSGLMYLAGSPEYEPVCAPETQGFYYACLQATFATSMALLRRGQFGEGELIDISVQECLAIQEHILQIQADEGRNVRRAGSQHAFSAPARVFPAADGFVYLFASRAHWPGFLDAWQDHPQMYDDAEWLPDDVRRAAADTLNEAVEKFTSQMPKAELADLLQAYGIPCLPVNTPRDFARSEQATARGLVQSVLHAELGEQHHVRWPVLLNGDAAAARPAPLLGEAQVDDLLRAAQPRGRGVDRAASKLPLEGVRVISLTTGIAGPLLGRMLAQFGAEVIKIESLEGGLDSFRFYSTQPGIESSGRFLESNMNVRSAQLNLKTEEGRGLLLELVRESDLIVQNFRPGVLERLGVGENELKRANPEIISVALPGMGSTGPSASYGTWGQTLSAVAGVTYLWTHPASEMPVGFQGAYPDYAAAALAASVIVGALIRKRHTGSGLRVELAQAEMVAYLLGVNYADSLINERDVVPLGNDSADLAPHGCYPCEGEDDWCVIAVETEQQWRNLCAALGSPDLAVDSRFASVADRQQHRESLDGLIARWTSARPAREAERTLQQAGVPCGVVATGADLLDDPQLRARGLPTVVVHHELRERTVARLPLHMSVTRIAEPRAMGPLGADNQHVFGGILGYAKDRIEAWQTTGIIR